MSIENALGFCDLFESGEVAKVITVKNFSHEFPIDLRIAGTDYGLYDSVKIFMNRPSFSYKNHKNVNSWQFMDCVESFR